MQQCGGCLKVYDESEDSHCPFCTDDEYGYSDDDLGCEVCHGEGVVECLECGGGGVDILDSEAVCLGCNGTGEVECLDCDSTG